MSLGERNAFLRPSRPPALSPGGFVGTTSTMVVCKLPALRIQAHAGAGGEYHNLSGLRLSGRWACECLVATIHFLDILAEGNRK